jgi:hypothetical protein
VFILSGRKIHYLGHIISGEGISVDPEKVKAIMDWPIPKNAHEIQKLYGFSRLLPKICGWILQRSQSQLPPLQRKGVKYEWTEECNKAFSELKRPLTSAPILRVPDMDKGFYCMY